MPVKELVQPFPGLRRLPLIMHHLTFRSSGNYWERRYARGFTSGDGSYGALGEAKAEFVNKFVRDRQIGSVIEFGCGDGHQLSLADYPRYIGLDVSRCAIEMCRRKFAADLTKSFFLYDCECFVDHAGVFAADLAISLDVIFHLVEDDVFEAYMRHIFGSARRYVVMYSTDIEMKCLAPHVRHRNFSRWVAANLPHWQLQQADYKPVGDSARADFFVYARAGGEPARQSEKT